jgi:6-phosphofructokinase
VCLPCSINNDLPGSELSIGADTALNTIVEAVDKLKTTAIATRRCYVVEVMGRECGYLALMGGLASGAERVYLPEEGVTLNDLLVDVKRLIEAFQKGKLAPSTFATAYSPWTVGYMAGSAAVKTLGKKKYFFLARADSWGWDIRDGVRAAAKELGAQEVGYDEVSLGTSDFTTVLQKVRAAKPDVFISAQFAADAVALLKQVQQMGLNKEMTIFNSFITNVVAKGLPPEALQGVYAMHYFYYDLAGFEDKAVAATGGAPASAPPLPSTGARS